MFSYSRVISEIHLSQVGHWRIGVVNSSGDVDLTLAIGARRPGVFGGLAV